MNYLSPSDPSIPDAPIIQSLILSPIFEELIFRRYIIEIIFICFELVLEEFKISTRFLAGYFSVTGLIIGLLVIFLPFTENLEIALVISILLALALFKVILNRSINEKLIILIGISSVGFGLIHVLLRFIPTVFGGLFFAVLLTKKTKLEYWYEMRIKQLKLGF